MYRQRANHDLHTYGRHILSSEEFKEALSQKHHFRSSVGTHSLRVANAALKMGYLLEHLGISSDKKRLVVGGLSHDLGILHRKDKFSGARDCCARHPVDSLTVAQKLTPDLDQETREAILRHMFPLTIKPPTSLEGVLISLADKYASIKDLISHH